MLNNGKAMACLLLLCLFIVQACRKDNLIPNSSDLKNGISIAEAKQYFEKNIRIAGGPKRLMSTSGGGQDISPSDIIKNKQPMWDYAYNQVRTTGQGIKVPIDFGNAYAVVTKKTNALLPLASLNYLYMYKDSMQNIRAEWVMLKPDSAWLYGKRDSYSGRILIRDWNGSSIRFYDYINGQVISKIKSNKQQRLSSTGKLMNTGDINEVIPDPSGAGDYYCIRISTGTCPKLYPCSPSYCDMCLQYCAKQFCTWITTDCTICPNDDDPLDPDDVKGGGTPSDPRIMNPAPGGGPDPGNYPPSGCNPDPNYQVPSYPAPPGYNWVMPCSSELTPLPEDPTGPGAPLPEFEDETNIPSLSVVYDPFEQRTMTFGEITDFVNANPELLDYIEANDVPPVTVPFLWTKWTAEDIVDCVYEFAAIKVMHPNWSSERALATAIYYTYRGKFHFALDVVGLFPVYGDAADLVNGAIYFVEGDRFNAALSVSAAIPVWGWVSTGGKWVRTTTKIITKPISTVAGKIAYRAVKSAKGSIRFVKLAVGEFSFSAVKALRAIKPADKTLTNLSGYLLEQSAHRLKPMASSLKSKIDDIVLNADAYGTKTEALCDELFQADGFVKYDAKFGSNNGFDGVYIKKNAAGHVEEIIINEAKQVTSKGNIKLNARTPNKGPQMSEEWINQTIDEMKLNPSTSALASTLLANREKIVKTVTAVDKSVSEIIIAKLSYY